jgi:hypothetical protein
MREEIYLALNGKYRLEKSKELFDRFGKLYEEKIKL